MRSFKEFLIENDYYSLTEAITKSAANMMSSASDQLLRRLQSEDPTHQDHSSLISAIENAPEHHQKWTVTRYIRGGIPRLEDIPSVLDNLKIHDMKLEAGEFRPGHSLSKIPTHSALFSLVNKGKQTTKTQLLGGLDPSTHTVTGKNEHWVSIIPHNRQTAVQLSQGTSWCTGKGDMCHNMFDHYNKDGQLHILIPMNPTHKDERYQIHLESQQYMDKNDSPVGIDTLSSIHEDRPFPNGSIIHKILNADTLPPTKENHGVIVYHSKNNSRKLELLRRDDLSTNHLNEIIMGQGKISNSTMKMALAHPNANHTTTQHSAKHPDKDVVMAALAHPKADYYTTQIAATHPDKDVALAALAHPKANHDTTRSAAQHPDKDVVMAALAHPEAYYTTTRFAAKHPDKDVVMAALAHPEADYDTTRSAAQHPDKDVVMAALAHPKADLYTTWDAAKHPDKDVALAALAHPKADNYTTRNAAKHPDKDVALAALAHPEADDVTTYNAADVVRAVAAIRAASAL